MRNSRSTIVAIIILHLWLISAAVMGQQNPDCSGCTCTFPSMIGETLTTASTHGPCNSSTTYNVEADRYARFWGIAGNRYVISLCSEGLDTELLITMNTSILAMLACDDDGCGTTNGPSMIEFIPDVSNTYRIYIFNSSCGTVYQPGTLVDVTITCSPVPPPVNDLPCDAIQLSMAIAPCSFIPGTTVAATNSEAIVPGIGAAPNCAGALYQGADVWYTVMIPPSGLIGIQTQENTLCAGAFQLYTATSCNGTFTQLPGSCITTGFTGPSSEPGMIFDAFANGLAPGQVIYIRYWERNGNQNGTFGICAYEVQYPPNDAPCSAIGLTLNTTCQSTQFIYENATISLVPTPSCGTAPINDLWFSFTVPITLPANWSGVSVNTQTTPPLDLGMAWYRLSNMPCLQADLTEIACSSIGSITSSTTSISLIPGETIYVRIWGDQPWYGPFDICAVLDQPPSNDDPCIAMALPLQYGCLMSTFTNTNATNTGTTPPGASLNGVPTPTCGLPVNDDVWFTVPVPPNGTVQLDLLAGTMTDAAMAAYRVTSGSCTTNDLELQQISCAINGSEQGTGNELMPYLNITGEAPGSTLYIRVWHQTGSNGTFSICARRTDPPPGNCFYTLTMTDAAGDGWGGSFVTVCIAGNCSDYSVLGATTSVSFGANVGQSFNVSYTAVGGSQNQNSFVVSQYGQPVYVSGTSPGTGMVFSETVSCDPPPAPSGDCLGAISICTSNAPVACMPYQGSSGNDLTPENAGCLIEEAQGHWFVLYVEPNSAPCTPMAFDIVGGNQSCGTSTADNVFDFAIWGPFPPGSNPSIYCSMLEQPYRCNYASVQTPDIKGLAFDNDLPEHQFSGGGSMSKHLIASSCDRFLLFVNNRDSTGQQFQIHWKTPPPDFQVATTDCASPAAPGSYAQIGCVIDGDCVPITVAVPSMDPNTVQINPNPVEEILRISDLGSGIMDWQIFDGSGRKVLSGKEEYVSVLDIEVHFLDAGSYYLQIKGEDGTAITTHRFIKQ